MLVSILYVFYWTFNLHGQNTPGLEVSQVLTLKAPNTTIAEFANPADPSESTVFALLSLIFQYKTVSIKSFFEILQT